MKRGWFNDDFLNKPVDGIDHQWIRKGLWIGGRLIACCYYLSMLRHKDYSLLPVENLLDEIIEYVVHHTSPKATIFTFDKYRFTDFALPFFKQQFKEAFGIDEKFSKEERGLILILRHPEWTDEKIRITLKTTEKQMNRWVYYRIARRTQKESSKK